MSRGLWTLLLVACNDDPTDGSGTPGDDDDTPADTDATDTGTQADTDTTLRDGCYADNELDVGDDGSVEGTGIDVYDTVRTDLRVHAESSILGSLAFVMDWDYDTNGYLLRYASDGGGDGLHVYEALYTNDERGNVLLRETDEDGDSELDEIVAYTWNENDDVLSLSLDSDADGDPDYGYAYTYDEEGFRVAATEDQDGDEVTDMWYAYFYDDMGRYVRTDGDAGNDGTLDYQAVRTYTDPVLYVGGTVIDSDYDGTPDFSDLFEAVNGDLVSLSEDEGADGFVDHVASWTYEDDTGLLLVQDDERFMPPPDDSFVDWTHLEYTYDDQGRLVDLFSDGEVTDDDDPDVIHPQLFRGTWTFGGTCP